MLMNLSDNFWILLCCLLTSSFAILAWVRAIICEHKTEKLSDQLALYVEASLNMSAYNSDRLTRVTPVNRNGNRRHILNQAQACVRNGLAAADIQVEFGLRDDEMKLMRALPQLTRSGLKQSNHSG